MPLQNWSTPLKLYHLKKIIEEAKSKFVISYGDKKKFINFIEDKIKSKGKNYLSEDIVKDLRDDIRDWEENKKTYNKYLKFFDELLSKL
ncbi:hypothetical protein HRbin34_00112 [bacterium HR34]|nr:hypothetical protein HRbin34_00112 [bacterium HR34]